ncbi:MAG: hypothetical protein ACI4Q4_08585, partial [Oscillospiraceae bacterium]
SEGYDKWERALQECRDENITLIIIGLGDQVDKERLSADAVSTGGYYLNVKDADCIETISESILAVIQNKGIQVLKINDSADETSIINTYLVSDSGFDKNKHGFVYNDYDVVSLYNGFTTETGCQSVGIAELTRQWYIGDVKTSMAPAVTNLAEKYSSEVVSVTDSSQFVIPLTDYNLSNIRSDVNTNFTDITIPSLRAVTDYNSIINDYVNAGVNMHVEDGCLMVNDDKVPQYITDNPERFFKAVVELADTKYYTDTKHKKLQFNRICVYYPYLNYYIDREVTNDDDYLIRVIYTIFTQQLTPNFEMTYFVTPDSGVPESVDNTELLDHINERLLHGDPCVIAYDTTGSKDAGRANHAVNAVALYRSCEDARIYYLKCYDIDVPDRYIYFKIDATDIQNYVITDLWRNQQVYFFGTQALQ